MTVNGVLISIISQRVALGVHVSTTACGIYCRLSSRRGRVACFFLPQDENSLINCFCEKVTNRKNKQVTFFTGRDTVLITVFLANQILNENPSQ